MFHIAAVYRVWVGPCFYIGSAKKIGSRISFHRVSLARGEHPNRKLQEAWGAHQSFIAEVIDECAPELLRDREDQAIKAAFNLDGCCNLSESSRFNSKIGEQIRERWARPEYRRQVSESLTGRHFSSATREKMAEAKRGNRNSKANACLIRFNGEEMRFQTESDAAAHYKVTQQAMSLWLGGKSPWPSSGGRTKPHNRRLAGMTGEYVNKLAPLADFIGAT